jgi:hypothetical protein
METTATRWDLVPAPFSMKEDVLFREKPGSIRKQGAGMELSQAAIGCR